VAWTLPSELSCTPCSGRCARSSHADRIGHARSGGMPGTWRRDARFYGRQAGAERPARARPGSAGQRGSSPSDGIFNILEAQITALDPANKTSRVRVFRFRTERAVCFQGSCARSHLALRAAGTAYRAPARWQAGIQPGARSTRAHHRQAGRCAAGILRRHLVDMPRAEFEPGRHNKEWIVQFPPDALRAL
jgi:hypothetical protein